MFNLYILVINLIDFQHVKNMHLTNDSIDQEHICLPLEIIGDIQGF
jgi:hypothetical protein